jgi:hypothetical protein
MISEQIHASLDKMLVTPKTKNFINHLVRSYIPVSNIEKVLETPKGDFKCVITKEPLVSVQSIFKDMDTEEFKKDFMENLKSMFSEEKIETQMSKLLDDKKLGFTGKDTTTYMSYTATQEFYNWVITKSLKGDKHINWLLGSINRNTFIKRAANIEDQDVQKKVSNLKKVSGVSTYSLGDATDVLSKLKAKLDNK